MSKSNRIKKRFSDDYIDSIRDKVTWLGRRKNRSK